MLRSGADLKDSSSYLKAALSAFFLFRISNITSPIWWISQGQYRRKQSLAEKYGRTKAVAALCKQNKLDSFRCLFVSPFVSTFQFYGLSAFVSGSTCTITRSRSSISSNKQLSTNFAILWPCVTVNWPLTTTWVSI